MRVHFFIRQLDPVVLYDVSVPVLFPAKQGALKEISFEDGQIASALGQVEC